MKGYSALINNQARRTPKRKVAQEVLTELTTPTTTKESFSVPKGCPKS
jgi:hypothetical protein